MSWFAAALGLTAATSSYALALRGFNGRRRAGEPPLIRGSLPHLGSALSVGRDAPRYLAACRERHGDVFTLIVAGRRMTFVLDPLSYVAVLKCPQLQFGPVEDEAMALGFGLPGVRERMPFDQLVEYDHTYLKGPHLAPVTARMAERLGPAMLRAASHDWRAVELYELVWRLLFAAGTDALFGDGHGEDEQLAASFKQFDRAFPLLMGDLPELLTKPAIAARADVRARLLDVGGEGSEWMAKRSALLNEPQLNAGLNVSLLWAATANTAPTIFWTLVQLLRHGDALAAVRAELREVVPGFESDEPLPPLPAATLDRLRLLDSAVKEALRLSTGTMTVREVVESFTFEAPCGSWALRKGDRVCLFPYLMHRDAEIHPEPERYVVDRFYSEVGVKRFAKRGQPVAIPLMPFGGGQSMCPGRFFAINEAKLLIALALHLYAIELDDPRDPGLDVTRAMLGILPPARPVPARIKLRDSASGPAPRREPA
jgi:cytochrome P450